MSSDCAIINCRSAPPSPPAPPTLGYRSRLPAAHLQSAARSAVAPRPRAFGGRFDVSKARDRQQCLVSRVYFFGMGGPRLKYTSVGRPSFAGTFGFVNICSHEQASVTHRGFVDLII